MADRADSTPEVQGQTILERYERLYAAGDMSLSRNYSDKFPFLEHLLKPEVVKGSVLDFGCGPGRLSLMLARWAREVEGVDFSEPGIETARDLARITGSENVRFSVGDLDSGDWLERRFDVIVVAGTLEHLADPPAAIATWRDRLGPGGLLCVQTPSFDNFRGDVYTTLLKLVGLPMSLTDVWQVNHRDVESWAREAGMRVDRVAGGHYDFAFLGRVREDFEQRVRAAARDKGVGEDWDFEAFFDWLDRRAADNRLLLEHFEALGALRPVPPSRPLRCERPAGMADDLWERIELYLTYSGWRERWYADTPPLCFLGGSAAYFLRVA